MAIDEQLVELIRRHEAAVHRYLRVLGCEAALADDLTQETFVQVLIKPIEDYHPAATAGYLRKAARNLFLMHLRKIGSRPATSDIDEVEHEWASWAKNRAGEDDGGAERVAILRECIELLDERARQAIDLRYRADAGRIEMARALGIEANGVKTLLQRAREKLRHCMEERLAQ